LVFEDHIEKKKLEANQENSRVVKNQKNSHWRVFTKSGIQI
jgi:hypothetical protein